MSAKTMQIFTKSLFVLSGLITLFILVIIIGYILINGFHIIDLEFLLTTPKNSGKSGGILPMIISSFYLITLAILISAPIGVGSAIYIVEYAKNDKLKSFIKFISQTLASIPSIIFGLFALSFLIFFLKMSWSIVSGSIILAIMSIPIIFQVSEVALTSVPESYKEACYGLGASKWQCICTIILPYAISGIFTGIILALTRAISEAAAIMYVVGSSLDIPTSIFDAGRPLPLHLYILASEGISIDNAFGVACVLIIIVLIITLFTNFCINQYQNRMMGVSN